MGIGHEINRVRVGVVTTSSARRPGFRSQHNLPVWMGAVLAAVLGQIRLPGSGCAYALGAIVYYGRCYNAVPMPTLPQCCNAVAEFIPVARIADMKVRIRKIVAILEKFYAGSRTPCVLGQLASSDVGAIARKSLQRAFEHWIKAIDRLARDSGMPPARARPFAEDWVAGLQGALILQAATGNAGSFKRALQTLLELVQDARHTSRTSRHG